MRARKWTKEILEKAVRSSYSVRQVIQKIGLIPAGGNYAQIKKYIEQFKLDTKHFKGMAWNKGLTLGFTPHIPLEAILVKNNTFQSYKLKNRLFRLGLKLPLCEKCGWAEKTEDGRIPVELDHINGDRLDNRIENLRILCPNCHSLQSTHRGLNKKTG